MEAAKQGKGEKSEKSDSSEEEGRRKRLGRKERASSFGGALVALKGPIAVSRCLILSCPL
eukprot:2922148-Rhodomonas_salina.1